MKVIAIIAEYNPLHNGHEYQMEIAKKVLGADYIIIIMSGNYNQRGMPAIISKGNRANFAISAGADLVIELPICFALEDIPVFSYAAINIINNLGVVDSLLFGSESGNIDLLYDMANVLQTNEFEVFMKNNSHITSPSKRREKVLKQMGYEKYVNEINKPNNLFGVYFILALRKLDSKITPLTIKRKGAEYFDLGEGPEYDNKFFSSASAIRSIILDSECGKDFPDSIYQHVPSYVSNTLRQKWHVRFPIERSDFWKLIKQDIVEKSITELQEVSGVDKEVATCLKRNVVLTASYKECIEQLSTFNPYLNYHRLFFRIVTNSKKSFIKEYMDRKFECAINIVSSGKKATELVKKITLSNRIELYSGQYQGEDPFSIQQYNNQKVADCLYNNVIIQKYS